VAVLPYVTAPGNVERALNGIKSAATPDRVSQDFVKTILKIPGGSGDQITSYLRKIGFSNSDGTPTDLYRKFRNAGTSGMAAAEALAIGYAPLKKRNEFWHELTDDKLKGLILEETGQSADSNAVALVTACIKAIKKFAKWSTEPLEEMKSPQDKVMVPSSSHEAKHTRTIRAVTGLGMNLSYTINLNLPATTDPAVFNAIFKSLKENLLETSDDEG
jgi:hypothetical protein